MRLQHKIAGLLTAVFFLFLLASSTTTWNIVQSSYQSFEESEGEKNLHRCFHAISREIKHLETTAHDWSFWDDTYTFIQDHNTDYIQSNLTIQTFIDNDINLIALLDTNRRLSWGKVYSDHALTEYPQDLLPLNALVDIATAAPNQPQGVAGFQQTPQGTLLLAVQPIFHSDHSGPPRGQLIMGRSFDDEDVARLQNQTRVKQTYYKTQEALHNPHLKHIVDSILRSNESIYFERNDKELIGYTLLRDLQNRPIMIMETSTPRVIYNKGLQTTIYLIMSLTVSTITIMLLLFKLIELYITKPIKTIASTITSLRTKLNIGASSKYFCKNEITQLHQEIKSLFTDLEISQKSKDIAHKNLTNEIKERKKAEKALITHQYKLQLLTSQLALTEERERRQIASDLHDRISQSLAICQIRVKRLTSQLQGHSAQASCLELHEFLEEIANETRTLTFEISPPILYDLGLNPALDWLVEQLNRQSTTHITYFSEAHHEVEDSSLRILVFRAARELLFNVLKHSDATHAHVQLSTTLNRLIIEVQDDGNGFVPEEKTHQHGFGLFAIQERVCSLGGTFSIVASPDNGCTARLEVPFSTNKNGETA